MAGVVTWLVHRWAQSRGWSDLHLLALASGALVAHTLYGALAIAPTTADCVGLAVLGLVMVVLLALFAVRVRGRISSDANPAEESGTEAAVPGVVHSTIDVKQL